MAVAGATLIDLLKSLSGEVFGGDVSENLVQRLTGHEELLRNHDLTELVGQALSISLLAAVEQLEPPLHRAEKEPVLAWARGIGPRWEEQVKSERAIPDALREASLPGVFAVTPEAVGHVRILHTDDWFALLKNLGWEKAPEGMVTATTGEAIYWRLAALLPEIFPKALREVIKHDAAGDGKGHAGLTLLMLGELVAFAREQKATNTVTFEAFEKRCIAWGEDFARKLDVDLLQRHQEILQKIGVDVAGLKAHLDTRLDALPKEVAKAVRIDPRLWAGKERAWRIDERNQGFVGRRAELAALSQAFERHQKTYLFGLGGMGKTQTALEYAHASAASYPLGILWVRAESAATLDEEYRSVAYVLRLPQAETPDISVVREAVRQELSTHDDYLLVLDNVEDLQTIAPYLPTGGGGQVLITTRIHQIVPKDAGVSLQELNDDAGADLLLTRAGHDPQGSPERKAAKKFSHTVDGLPLALDQAGAYIAASVSTVASYQALYAQSGARLRKRRGAQAGISHESVATTFEVAVQRIGEVWPEDSEDEETAAVAREAAIEFLRVCAFLAPDDIPDVILKQAGSHLSEPLQKCAADALVYDVTIQRLLKFSLMSVRTDESYVYGTQLFSLHRLVQDVILDGLTEEEHSQYQQLAITAVSQSHPTDWNTRWDHYSHLASHSQKITDIIFRHGIETEHAGLLCNQLGFHKERQADYATVLPLYKRALSIRETSPGANHPDTAESLNNLGALYRIQGNYAAALPLFERALSICEMSLGANHPNTATSLNNLAMLYESQGNYAAALPLFERALLISEMSLGADHPNTATSLNNLAGLHKSQGDYAAALPLFERALLISEMSLGANHPDTATSLNNLAMLYKSQGNYAAALPLFERALLISEMSLGADHPDTATSLNNLAGLHESQGNYAAALPLSERALLICETSLGADHPDTAGSLSNLAGLHESQGDYAAALPLFERALSIREMSLGANHPSTATSLNNLAGLHESQGNYVVALPLYERALSIREMSLGANHPSTATSLNNLAMLYKSQGNYAAALPLFERALLISEMSLGANHPSTATSLSNLAGLYKSQGDYAAALPLYKRALLIYETSLGANHPDTARSLSNLAELYESQGNYAAALPLSERALSIREMSLGANHPNTATSLNNLAMLYKSQGNYAAALPLFERALSIREMSLGANHPNTATSLNNLAMLYKSQGNYAAVLPLFERALLISEMSLGANHPDTARSLSNLAGLYESQGNYAAALLLYERALSIREMSLGANHPFTATSLNNLAELYKSQGDYAAALPLFERALLIYEVSLGANHPDTAQSLNNLAVMYYYMGKKADAVPLLKKAFKIFNNMLGRHHPITQETLQSLLIVLQELNMWIDRLPLLDFVDTPS
ncbi:tetratricopeptide repeat protein [Armatimonas sp.]|uniref:tetratricopeptide repeat protein n=1 Tax=Armatimonas sp. TaxID=1872638 RepID=UPI003752A4A6